MGEHLPHHFLYYFFVKNVNLNIMCITEGFKPRNLVNRLLGNLCNHVVKLYSQIATYFENKLKTVYCKTLVVTRWFARILTSCAWRCVCWRRGCAWCNYACCSAFIALFAPALQVPGSRQLICFQATIIISHLLEFYCFNLIINCFNLIINYNLSH